MTRRLTFLSVVLALCLAAGTGSAHHMTYLGEDQSFQYGKWSGTENFVVYWWSVAASSLWWWADPDLSADAQTAVSNWQTATGLPFYRVGTRASADMVIAEDTDLDAYGMMELTQVATDPGRNANYTYKAQLTIRNAGDAPVGGWPATIAHEMGHVIGLHERYRDSGSTAPFCNPESTIMNSGGCENRPVKPSSLDVERVANLYRNGELLSMATSSSWFTNGLYLTWKDGAWGEYEHRLYLYYWDGSQWLPLDSIAHTAQTGARDVAWSSRTLSRTFNRTAYGRPAGYYTVCGYPVFRYGAVAWRCANYSWVY